MSDGIFRKLANNNECPQNLRREFLNFHRNQKVPNKNNSQLGDYNCHKSFLNDVYAHNEGVVFGERHFNRDSIAFLASNMDNLAQLGVKTVFFEGIYFGLENGMDGGRDVWDSTHEQYYDIIHAAKRNNMQVVGIDAAGCKRGEGVTRDIFMNAYAQAIINNLENRGKWFALVGIMHLNDSNYICPSSFEKFPVRGLCELTGGVSVILNPDNDEYVSKGGEFFAAPSKKVKADYILGIKGRSDIADDELAKIASECGLKIGHYDIDSFARKNVDGSFEKAAIFSLIFEDTAVNLEALKFDIKSNSKLLENQWVNISIESNEMLFSCNYDIMPNLCSVIKKSYAK